MAMESGENQQRIVRLQMRLSSLHVSTLNPIRKPNLLNPFFCFPLVKHGECEDNVDYGFESAGVTVERPIPEDPGHDGAEIQASRGDH